MGIEWGGGATRRPLLRRTKAVRRCPWGCCTCGEDRKYLRHKESNEMSRMLDDYLDEPYEDLQEQAIDGAYYATLDSRLDALMLRDDERVYEILNEDEPRDGDDAHTTARRNGFRWDVV